MTSHVDREPLSLAAAFGGYRQGKPENRYLREHDAENQARETSVKRF